MKNISNLNDKKTNKYFVGIRESDIENVDYFKNSISMFSTKTSNALTIRANPNFYDEKFNKYLSDEIKKIVANDPTCSFMFYNTSTIKNLNNIGKINILCQNTQSVLDLLNDKIISRKKFKTEGIDIIPSKIMTGEEICKEVIENKFAKNREIVVQTRVGNGGIGTYLLNNKTRNEIILLLDSKQTYIVSDYIKNSISVNVHVFVSKSKIVLSPGSVQINQICGNQIVYRGADFFAFNELPTNIKKTIENNSEKVALILKNWGYRGVAGVDLIVDQHEKVYLSEVNPRFQASSALLNKYIRDRAKDLPSLAQSIYELNEQSFEDNIRTDLSFDNKIPYSCYYYYKESFDINVLRVQYDLLKKHCHIDADGVIFNEDNLTSRSYLFRAVFQHPICTISPDNRLWVNDNIIIHNNVPTPLELKVALLNQGVRLINEPVNIKPGAYDSIDIHLTKYLSLDCDININCAYKINLSQYSPYQLDCRDNSLYFYNQKIGEFEIELNVLKDLSLKAQKILFLATDRLRIKLIDGCEFKNSGVGCAFCDMSKSTERFTLDDIVAALDELDSLRVTFRHILIGGGTRIGEDTWNLIIDLTKILSCRYPDKPVSLMSILPPVSRLVPLKDAGISEVAFNLEISDENLRKKYMLGKGCSKDLFYNTMSYAVQIFGIGNVRSALLVGVDKERNLLKEVRQLATNNILPCLSALRCLPNSNFPRLLNPTNEYLVEQYRACCEVISSSSSKIKQPGPICKRCRNNMLTL